MDALRRVRGEDEVADIVEQLLRQRVDMSGHLVEIAGAVGHG